MQTECISEQLRFEGFDGLRVVAAFDGGAVTSDAGALLLRETDRAIALIDGVAACFRDRRDQSRVVHSLRTLIGQRIWRSVTRTSTTTTTCGSIRCWRCSRTVWSRAVPAVPRSAAKA